MSIIRFLNTYRDLIANLVSRELKSRYKGSLLGLLWTVLTPLFMAVIYLFFLSLLARNVPMAQIIIGVFAWQFTMMSVNGGMTCITGSANLVKKVYFPRMILPLSMTTANLVHFALSLIVQFLILILLHVYSGPALSPWALALPLMIVYHYLFNLGLTMLLASANVYYRDTQHLMGVLTSAWFFVSPVMYHLDFVRGLAASKPLLTHLYMLNPMAVIITGYRAMILPDVVFIWDGFSIAGLVWPVAFVCMAYALFQRSEKYFADLL